METFCPIPRPDSRRGAASDGRAGAAALAARALADRFAGLPDGLSRWRLAAALRVAAPRLGLTPSMLALLAHYIDLTYDADWEAGSEPVIGRPLVEIAEALGRSERQIRNLERALMERGLLSWRDSGNQQRRAWRGRDGRLAYAYGPTLAPIGTRAAELVALASACRAEQAEARRLRLATGALRRRLRGDIAALADAGAGDHATELAARLAALTTRNTPGEAAATLRRRHESLERLVETAAAALAATATPSPAAVGCAQAPTQAPAQPSPEARPGPACGAVPSATAAMPEICGRPLPDTATRHCKSVVGPTRPITPRDAYRAAGPVVRELCSEAEPDWPALTHAARLCAPMLGLTQHDWAESCDTLGRVGATMAIILLENGMTRPAAAPHAPVTRPRAYLRALAQRHREGRLALDRSIRGAIARKARTVPEPEPERTAPQTQRYGGDARGPDAVSRC